MENPEWTELQLLGLWLLCGAVVVYVTLGWFPLIGVEGDDLGIAVGAWQLQTTGQLEHNLAYRYEAQPLTYVLTATLQHAFGKSTLEDLCLLSIAGFLTFLVFASLLVARLAEAPVPLAGLVLLLLPEVFVSSYYGNSNMVAAGLLLPALFLARRQTSLAVIGSGLLFSMAVFARLDALLISLAFLVLLWSGKWDTVRNLALFSGAVLAGVAMLILLTGLSPMAVLAMQQRHFALSTSPRMTVRMYLAAFPALTVLLGGWGVYLLLWQQRWRLLLLVAVGMLPLMLTYNYGTTTPKYLLYALPFFAVPMACGLQQIVHGEGQWRVVGGVVCLVLFISQYVLPALPWLDAYRTVRTHDGPRNLYALLYEPADWWRWKRNMFGELVYASGALQDYTERRSESLILAGEWYWLKWLHYELLRNGYTCRQGEMPSGSLDELAPLYHHVFTREGRQIIVVSSEVGSAPVRDWPLWRQHVGLIGWDEALLIGRPSHKVLGEQASWNVVLRLDNAGVMMRRLPHDHLYQVFPVGHPRPDPATLEVREQP